MSEVYKIRVGNPNRPDTIMVGRLEKKSGQSTTTGPISTVPNSRGTVSLPNRTEAWGVRLIDGAIPKGGPVSVTDPKYKGEVKWLKWGDPEGNMIIARYLRGYNTLDQHFQDERLGAARKIQEENESSIEAFFLFLENGENHLHTAETDPALIQMYRIHYLNGSSISKNPMADSPRFSEIEEKEEEAKQDQSLNAKGKAFALVMTAADDKGGMLRNFYYMVKGSGEESVKEGKEFTYLQKLADTDPERLVAAYEQGRVNASNLFEKMKSFDVLDLTVDGTIAAKNGTKKEIIATDVPGKGEEMLVWVIDNFLTDEATEIFIKLKSISATLK